MKNAVLWKRILNEGFVNDIYEPEKTDAIVKDVVTSPIIVDQRPGNLSGGMNWEEFDGIAFPFDKFWIEGHFSGESRWGSVFRVFRDPDKSVTVNCLNFLCTDVPCLYALSAARFLSNGSLYLQTDHGLPMQVNLSKTLVGLQGEEQTKLNLYTQFWFALDTLRMMTCKNVSLEPRDNDPKQVRRAIKRHGGNADKYRYHVLVVRPPGAKPGTKGEEIGIMPRHVCRGHFSEYGPEFNKGLLFGKYAGRFYVPPHMKGKKENGEVAKDYAVK